MHGLRYLKQAVANIQASSHGFWRHSFQRHSDEMMKTVVPAEVAVTATSFTTADIRQEQKPWNIDTMLN